MHPLWTIQQNSVCNSELFLWHFKVLPHCWHVCCIKRAPLTLRGLLFDRVIKNVIVRQNLFGLFTYTESAFFGYFRPNNFGCRTFGASLVNIIIIIIILKSWRGLADKNSSGIPALQLKSHTMHYFKQKAACVNENHTSHLMKACAGCVRLSERHTRSEKSLCGVSKCRFSPILTREARGAIHCALKGHWILAVINNVNKTGRSWRDGPNASHGRSS